MSKEKQIEEMAHIVSNAIKTWVYEAPPTSNPHFVAAAIYNAGYRKQSEGEWISVEERLPDDNERVLCFDPTLVESNLGAVSVQFGWCCKRRNMSITHWMPLPESPVMKGGAE